MKIEIQITEATLHFETADSLLQDVLAPLSATVEETQAVKIPRKRRTKAEIAADEAQQSAPLNGIEATEAAPSITSFE